MAVSVFCNTCLQQPRREMTRFALTNCGHVLCEKCLRKGKKDICTACGALCRTVFLSKQMNPELQALFMDVAELCKKYSKEFSQISEFQENHKRHLLTFYKGQISKLEETLKKVTEQTQGPRGDPVGGDRHFKTTCKSMRPPQQSTRLPAANTSRNSGSGYQTKQMGCSSCTFPQPRTSSSERVEFMEIDPESSQMKNLETSRAPYRLSLISPPQDGRMGSVPYRGSHLSGLLGSQKGLPGSQKSTPLRIPVQTNVPLLLSPAASQRSKIGIWDTSGPRVSQLNPQTSLLQSDSVRQQISIPNLLWKKNFEEQLEAGTYMLRSYIKN